ncbi:LOW QUALITY PROTEIN: dehydrogenase/reductase SDR family member 4-like [Rhynchonycteris naso]
MVSFTISCNLSSWIWLPMSGQEARLLLDEYISYISSWKLVRTASLGVARQDRLANKVALVRASTNKIGFAIAQRLAQDGAHVVVSSRKQNVDRAVAALQGEGLSVTGTVCHVGKAEDRERLVATAVKLHGGIDILVSNAASTLSLEEVWDKVQCKREESLQFAMNLQCTWIGKPEECAGIVSFLCSKDASYITGETVAVGGGHHPTSEYLERAHQQRDWAPTPGPVAALDWPFPPLPSFLLTLYLSGKISSAL